MEGAGNFDLNMLGDFTVSAIEWGSGWLLAGQLSHVATKRIYLRFEWPSQILVYYKITSGKIL